MLPEVGMGATLILWSDRHAYTVVEVKSPRTIIVQRDNAKRTDNLGMSESQEYSYTPNPNAPKEVFTFRKNGRWVEKGKSIRNSPLVLGIREEYYDYYF